MRRYRCGRSGLRLPGWSNRTQCSQRLATTAMLLRCLGQGWPTRGSRAVCPVSCESFSHSLFVLSALLQPSSGVMLRLATHNVHCNNHFVERITTRRVTSGGIHLPGFAPGQHSFKVRRNIAAVAALFPI